MPSHPPQSPPSPDLEKHAAMASDRKAVDFDTVSSGKGSLTGDGVTAGYELKCNLVNKCLQEEIGFGRYQWQLFILSGLGWMADNLWMQGVAIVLGQVQLEFNPKRIEYATLALYVGLIVGAMTWGLLADIIGRRLSFSITLCLAGIFGVACGGAPNFIGFCGLMSCIGFGVGGNLPVDGALYLEHIPQSAQWTLTLLSAFWAVGQVIASLIAWAFIGQYSCPSNTVPGECAKGDNMGWRYLYFVLGGITFVIFIFRFVVFSLEESSKFLIAKGRDQEAIAVLERIAKRNGRTITLTLKQFQAIDGGVSVYHPPPTIVQILSSSVSKISLSHVKPLFANRRLAINTSFTLACWAFIGLAGPLYSGFLPLYLAERVENQENTINTTFRNYTIISVLGVPGSIAACIIVDWTRNNGRFTWGGRKFSMALFTALTGVFLFLFTTASNESGVLGYNCASSFAQNAMYGILYAYTPEVFPGPHRGTADALASALNRIFGLLAPVIKMATTTASGETTANINAPIYVSASVFLLTATVMLGLPIETAGRAAL